MKYVQIAGMVLATTVCAAGCARMTTKVVEKPRVDQELGEEQGNRGYLLGTAPEPGPRKTTRKMLETDIELPTREEMNPWRKSSQAAPPRQQEQEEQTQVAQVEPPVPLLEPVMPLPTQEEWQAPAPSRERILDLRREEPVAESTTYTVQKGDTLQKIASKFYGSSKPWRKIYEANQASLKSPDNIYPGQKLVIPPVGEAQEEQPNEGDWK